MPYYGEIPGYTYMEITMKSHGWGNDPYVYTLEYVSNDKAKIQEFVNQAVVTNDVIQNVAVPIYMAISYTKSQSAAMANGAKQIPVAGDPDFIGPPLPKAGDPNFIGPSLPKAGDPNFIGPSLPNEGTGNPKEVNIHGKINSELDEVDLTKKVIYEDKNASKLYMDNPDFPQTEEQWAKKQIFDRGSNRVNALQQDDFKLSGSDATQISDIQELKEIKDYVFRVDADTPELRAAVQTQLEKLKVKYPDYNFSATFGGEN